jgi:hypothetical protein
MGKGATFASVPDLTAWEFRMGRTAWELHGKILPNKLGKFSGSGN